MVGGSGSIALKRRGGIQVGTGSKSIVESNVFEDHSKEVNRRRAYVKMESLCKEISFLIDLIGLRDGHSLCT